MSIEFGIFTDEGKIEGDFCSKEDAGTVLARCYPEEDAHVAECCSEHPDHERESCEICNDEEDEDEASEE